MADQDQSISSGISFPEDPTAGIPANVQPDFPPESVPEELPAIVQQSHAVSRPDLVRINPRTNEADEIAALIVRGQIFEDWETVWIQWNWTDWFARFRFTCAELEPYPTRGLPMQFEPQDPCEIYLGGIKVIDGLIVQRQVAYDANMHGVQLEGYSASWFAQRSSIDHKTKDFDNKNFLQIADEILAPTGVGYKTIGFIDTTPFKSGATPPSGATIGQFLESLARDRKIIVSSTPDGDFLFIGEHSFPSLGDLIEGRNIKKMQCVITNEQARSMFITNGQKKGSDQSNMRSAAEQEARAKGILKRYSILTTAMEHPVDQLMEIERRNDTEKMFNEDVTVIDATVTVYGWFRQRPSFVPSIIKGYAPVQELERNTGGAYGHILWQAGDEVIVDSPMAMLYGQKLKVRTVTWTQDRQNGTQTTLQLVNPLGLNSRDSPIKREGSRSNTDAAQTPAVYDPGTGPG
jgi:prophage tail gpP-like protein